MIDGWESVSLEQQQAWLEDYRNIPDEAFDALSLVGLNMLHMAIFDQDLTIFGIEPDNQDYRSLIINAIRNDEAIDDDEFRSGVPADADI